MVDTPGAEAPYSPDITHVQPAGRETWIGHPRQLARLFSVEMWERFGFYGMRALLVLYLTKHFLLARLSGQRHCRRLSQPRLSDAAWSAAGSPIIISAPSAR